MINFNYETDFQLEDEARYTDWISRIISSEGKKEGEISYIFCDDAYLHKINLEYLNHDDLTDIISFDYSLGNELSGDIFISVERVKDNASDYNVPFDDELRRVMAHGVLHYAGYKDKTDADAELMQSKEDEKMNLFN
ncbi:MAG: rRNA maturation RNase YbeY [Flavobacterium sp.]|nr:MAG: rRNA maturation RNase YbeY [Flavobacterium sp.]